MRRDLRLKTYIVADAEQRIVSVKHAIRNARKDAKGLAGYRIFVLDPAAPVVRFMTFHRGGGTCSFRARVIS